MVQHNKPLHQIAVATYTIFVRKSNDITFPVNFFKCYSCHSQQFEYQLDYTLCILTLLPFHSSRIVPSLHRNKDISSIANYECENLRISWIGFHVLVNNESICC
jgi:hypothetical protein